MELKKRTFLYYQTVLDTRVSPEAGADIIVPDLYPDMQRIVDASGLACVKDKMLREDRMDVSGLVRVSVLYIPEGESKLRRIDVNIPFNHVFDGHYMSGCEALCEVKLINIETRAVNPRKISVLCQLEIHAAVYAPGEIQIPDEVTESCEVRKKSCKNYAAIAVKSKNFTTSEELEIPGSKPAIDEIVRAAPRFAVTDTKIVGNKVVVKAAAILGLLYLSAGEPVYTEQEFGISQIVEMDHLEDIAHVELNLLLTGIELDIRQTAGMDPRGVGVTLHLEAQAVAFVERRMEAVIDLYSTQQVLKPIMEPVMLTELQERGVRRQSVRELIELEEDARSVIDTQIIVGAVTQMDSGEPGCETHIKILYITDAGEYQCAVKKIIVGPGGELPVGTKLEGKLAGEVMSAPTSEGIELRFSVDFSLLATHSSQEMMVSGVNVMESAEKANHPSVVLRRCQENESLWDIAKRYNTTMRELSLANGLEDMELVPSGQLLLIPKKR